MGTIRQAFAVFLIAFGSLISSAASGQEAAAEPNPAPMVPSREPTQAEIDKLESIRRESFVVRKSLNDLGVLTGVISTVAGVAFMIPETDTQALRFAGLATTIFGVIDTVIGAVALAGIAKQEAEWEERRADERKTSSGYRTHLMHALDDERREAVAHGINLGLAVAYFIGGGTAIVASQLGVDHPERWLASGISICAQASMLLIFDVLGTVDSLEKYAQLQELAMPIFGIAPSKAEGAGVDVMVGMAKQF